jgi:putative ATP-binding cassette transporter
MHLVTKIAAAPLRYLERSWDILAISHLDAGFAATHLRFSIGSYYLRQLHSYCLWPDYPHGNNCILSSSDRSLGTNMLAFFFKHSRKMMLLSMLTGTCSGACNAALLAVINSVVKKNGSTTTLLWSFAGLCALLPVARFSSEFLLNNLVQGAMYKLRLQLCTQILTAPLRHLEQVGAPRLLAALSDDIFTITHALLYLPVLCVNISLTIGCLVYLCILSPTLLAIVLGFMAIGIASYQMPLLKVRKHFALARKDSDALQEHFRAVTQGAKELKIHAGRREAFYEGLERTSSSFQRHNLSGQNLYSAATSWGQTLGFLVIGLVLFLLPSFRHLSSSMMMAYTLTLLYLMTPLQEVLNTLPELIRANVALKTTEELGLTLSQEGPEELPETDLPAAEWKTLELKSVIHAYHREGESESFILGPINLSFWPGELVFIVGGNGSGKTTLVKLLTGLYSPEEGSILLDGEPIRDANRAFYRQYFSAVFSDFYLFKQLLGLINPKLKHQTQEYLAELKLSHKVRVVDGELSTTDLSQGQRKRLALLTAYLEDRPIYVFDEWAADQDPQFKAVFYMQILPELKARGKTVFVITHDDRYYDCADRIIKLDEGKVVSDHPNSSEIIARDAAM